MYNEVTFLEHILVELSKGERERENPKRYLVHMYCAWPSKVLEKRETLTDFGNFYSKTFSLQPIL